MSSPATVLIINLYTEMGGNEVAVLNLARTLDSSRYVPVLMFNRQGPFVERAREAGIRTVTVGYESVMLQRLIIPSVCWKNLKASYEIYKYLKASDVALIQCSDVLTLLLIVVPVLFLRIPVVYSVVFYYEWVRIVLFNLLALLIVDRIIANSSAVGNDLASKSLFLKKRMLVIHNGVDTARFHGGSGEDGRRLRGELGIPPEKKIVGMIARFDSAKGHTVFLRAAAQLRKERDDLCFLVIGGLLMSDTIPAWKAYRDQIMELHGELSLGGELRFLEHRDDIETTMRGLDVLVCPSTKEAFGLVVLEGVASGVPVVVSRGVGALEAVSGEPGVYVAEPGDPGSFARAISQALEGAGQRGVVSDGFKERVSWKRFAGEFERTYDDVRQGV